MLTTVWAPKTETVGETFLWHRPDDRLQIGVAYLWKQGAFRGLANYEVIPARGNNPNLRVGFGLQGIGTGNPGYFATTEKTWLTKHGSTNGYIGIGFRANEDHAHGLAGLKFTPARSAWTVGVQLDGHFAHPFVTAHLGEGWNAGFYLVEGEKAGLMLSWQR